MTPKPTPLSLLRWSMIFVWLSTACISAWESQGQALTLLSAAGIHNLTLSSLLIWGGVAVDMALGLALWLHPKRHTYYAAFGMMLLMTLVATLLDPALWLHPLGPLTKNVPIGAALWLLAKSET